MKTILVVANQTIGGAKLLQTVEQKAGGGQARVIICVPRTAPKHGNIIYDDAVYDAARVRVDLARTFLRGEGIEAVGEVGDPDPYSATMDAFHEHHPDEIVLSTLPGAASGWQRRDFVETVTQAVGGVEVTHVEVDLENEGLPFTITLVVANRTAASEDLLSTLRTRFEKDPKQVFIFIVPQEDGDGMASSKARARLVQVVDRAKALGMTAAGTIGDPDPYTATMNALQFFRVDDIIVSTLPETKSGWMRADLIDRLRSQTDKPIEHLETTAREAAATA